MDSSRDTEKSTGAESLTNPATYLHAALRAFVSSAYERVNTLLFCRDVFNFGPGTRYPDLKSLFESLQENAEHWRCHNAFIADLIEVTTSKAKAAQVDASAHEEDIAYEVFRALTNYFFSYIKVDRGQGKSASTVRVLFPVDFDCEVCPLKSNTRELCGNSCFRLAFFPNKPEEILKPADPHKYRQHYAAAQFALADASFAAAIPDLETGNAPEASLAGLMVPLLFGQALLLTDANAEKEAYELPGGIRTLSAHCRFDKMNNDLGIRSEAFLPIEVARAFMPGFYGGLTSGQSGSELAEWVPGFPNSSPFCIELYSPLPDWFAHASFGSSDDHSAKHRYFFQNSKSEQPITRILPPTPRVFELLKNGVQPELSSMWKDIGKVLALGFNSQHYSELMANQFVAWLRTVFKDSTYDPIARALKKRYLDYKKSRGEEIPREVEEFLNYLSGSADVLADVLNEIHHGMLLQSNYKPDVQHDLSTVEGINVLASQVDDTTVVQKLKFKALPYCARPRDIDNVSEVLQSDNAKGVLSRLVAEVIKNHNRHRNGELEKAVEFHVCLDPDQNRYSLHFCSPGVHIGLQQYLNLRQGLPHLQQESSQEPDGRLTGIGLALSRAIAEESGFEYVIGLGRDDKLTPAKATIDVEDYRRDLHTRIYFGGTL